MNPNKNEHIIINEHENGNIYIDIDDLELFDFIEDYLTEECEVEYDNHEEIIKKNKKIYRMNLIFYRYDFFPGTCENNPVNIRIIETIL